MVLVDICSNVELRENSHYCRKYNPQPLRFISEKKKEKKNLTVSSDLWSSLQSNELQSTTGLNWWGCNREPSSFGKRQCCLSYIPYFYTGSFQRLQLHFIKSICWVYSLSALKSMTLFYFILNYSIILYILIW